MPTGSSHAAPRGEALSPLDGLPRSPGAYALIVGVERELTVTLFGRRRFGLPRGHYLYAGSAYGPGGIGARVARHLRADKPMRWHIDQLTAAGRIESVAAIPGGDECAIVGAALGVPGAEVPVRGFGSSDCRACAAHLVRFANDLETRSALVRLADMEGAVFVRRL